MSRPGPKPRYTEFVNLKMEPELLAILKVLALKSGRSVSSVTRRMILHGLSMYPGLMDDPAVREAFYNASMEMKTQLQSFLRHEAEWGWDIEQPKKKEKKKQ